MSLESAQQFVSRMKSDKSFRAQAQSITGNEAIGDFLTRQGFEFDQRELIGAMAACMAELDKMMQV